MFCLLLQSCHAIEVLGVTFSTWVFFTSLSRCIVWVIFFKRFVVSYYCKQYFKWTCGSGSQVQKGKYACINNKNDEISCVLWSQMEVIIHGDGHQTLIRIRIYQIAQAADPDLSESPDCGSGFCKYGSATTRMVRRKQCCGSGMFIPDPGSWFLPIPDPGSRIPDPGSRIPDPGSINR